ncbi:unnamed protein product [Rotaria magnacalcarata]|uniref:Calcyclin-binding protein n=1 Tax=Rotaria magnacalcarata TaxID=392030 RepID=A0A8S2LD01_9BILA|nr:unnamed protein product [Rotaria magnacalcarata]
MEHLYHQQAIEDERRRIPINILIQNRIVINISGVRFETYKSTLEAYPHTLLGNAKRRQYYYDNVRDEYFFDHHRGCFEAILYYYQSEGRIRRPNTVPIDTFLEEITFFDLGQDALAQVREDENLKELEKTYLPRNRCRRYIWATMEYPEFSFIAKVVNILLLIIVFISTITLALETLPQFSHLSEEACNKNYQQYSTAAQNNTMSHMDTQLSEQTCGSYFSSPFHIVQTVCIGFFTLELILRLLSAPSLSLYIKDFMNWIDIISVVPFYIGLITQFVFEPSNQNVSILNSLALLRAIRCVRIFKFYRIFKNVKTIRVLVVTLKESMFDFLTLAAVLILLSFFFGAAAYLVESNNNSSSFDSIPKATYWGIVTITSVGYGDIVPITALGRLIAIMCAFSGVGTIGMFVSVIVDRYQRVFTRKLYIKPEKIDFNAYPDQENEDLESAHGNYAINSATANLNDNKNYELKTNLQISPLPPSILPNAINSSHPRNHYMDNDENSDNTATHALLSEMHSNAPNRPLDNLSISVSIDIDEIKRVIDQITRPRIKQYLELQQHKFEKELVQLQEKLQKQQQQADAQAAEKAANASASAVPTATRSYTKDISVYVLITAWDQTDKFVKIYVQNLDDVGNLPENQIKCSFEKRGFHLQIQNLKNINYSLKRIGLLYEIQPDQSTFKVKKDMIIVSFRKVESKNWECFLQDEKKAPVKPFPKLDNSKDSNESFLNMVEDMYEKGDDDTKRAIAKAWVQSREKMNSVGTEAHNRMNSGIVETPDFTFYPPPKKS